MVNSDNVHACVFYVVCFIGLRDESALGRTPLLSPTSVTSGYKSDVSYDRKLFTSSWQFVAELFPPNLLSYVMRRRQHRRIYVLEPIRLVMVHVFDILNISIQSHVISCSIKKSI